MNPMVGCRMKQARSAQVEQAVEVVRNGVDGTSRGSGMPRPKLGAAACCGAGWEWTPGAYVDGGMVFENPKRGSSDGTHVEHDPTSVRSRRDAWVEKSRQRSEASSKVKRRSRAAQPKVPPDPTARSPRKCLEGQQRRPRAVAAEAQEVERSSQVSRNLEQRG